MNEDKNAENARRYRAALESAEAVLAQTIEDRDLWEQRWRGADAEREEAEQLMMLDRDRLNKAVRERDDAREAGKALQEHTRKQRARIEKALAPLMSAQASMTRLELLEAVIAARAALTGEEEK